MDTNKVKHLEMIMGIINRMSGNLFLLKGWAITLIIALFTLVARDYKLVYIVYSFCVFLIFWLLDGYFLSLERRYRALYDAVRQKPESEIDFSMKIGEFNTGKHTWLRSMFSTTLNIFYGILFAAMLIMIFMTHVSDIKIHVEWREAVAENTVSE